MALYTATLSADVSLKYDEYDSFVVRAPSEAQARVCVQQLLAKNYGNEQSEADFVFSRLPSTGEKSIILASYNAG